MEGAVEATNPGQFSMPSAVVAPVSNPGQPLMPSAVVAAPTSNPGQPSAVIAPVSNPGQPLMPSAVVAAPTSNPGEPSAVIGQPFAPSAVLAAPTSNPGQPLMPSAVLAAPTSNPGQPSMPSAVVAPVSNLASNPGQPLMPSAAIAPTSNPAQPLMPSAVVAPTSNPGQPLMPSAVVAPLSNPGAVVAPTSDPVPLSPPVTPVAVAPRVVSTDSQPDSAQEEKIRSYLPVVLRISCSRIPGSFGPVVPRDPVLVTPTRVPVDEAETQPFDITSLTPDFEKHSRTPIRVPSTDDVELKRFKYQHPGEVLPTTRVLSPPEEVSAAAPAAEPLPPPAEVFGRRDQLGLRQSIKAKHLESAGDAAGQGEITGPGGYFDGVDEGEPDAPKPRNLKRKKSLKGLKGKRGRGLKKLKSLKGQKHDNGSGGVDAPELPHDGAPLGEDDLGHDESVDPPSTRVTGKAAPKKADVDYMVSYFQSFEDLEDRDALKQQVRDHMPCFEYVALDIYWSRYGCGLSMYYGESRKADSKRNVGYFSYGNCDAGLLVAIACAISLGWFIEEHSIKDPELPAITEKVQSLKASGRQTLESLDA
ncbi:unnamed protein product [Symbiodinium sp. CCMP2592]|nr:unnamed protein product [Symbiodinium sp. CCMP2592]